MAIIKVRNPAIDLDAAEIPNLDASKITTGTFADARIAASNVSQHAQSFDDNKLVNDISTLALRQASDENKSAYNTNSSSVDVFQDSTGITNLTNTNRNTNEYVSSFSTIAGNDTYTKKLMHYDDNLTNSASGSSLTFSSSISYDNSIYKFGTHSASFNGGSGYYANTSNYSDLSFGTSVFTIDFWFRLNNTPQGSQCCFNIFSGGAGSNGYRIIYNHTSGEGIKFINDGVYGSQDMNWGSLATQNTWHHCAIVRNSSNEIKLYKDGAIANTISNRGGNFNATSTDRNFFDDGTYDGFRGNVDEFRVSNGIDRTADSNDPLYISSGTSFTPPTNAYGATVANATGSFEGNAITASSSVSSMGAIITYQDQAGTNALNTDIVLQLSADGGSNYSTATLTALPNFSTGIKMAKVNDLSVTAGTSIKYKLSFANQASGSKEARIRGVALQY